MKKNLFIGLLSTLVALTFMGRQGYAEVGVDPNAPPPSLENVEAEPSTPAPGSGLNIDRIGGTTEFPEELPRFNLAGEQDPISAVEKVILNYVITPIFFLAGGVAVIMVLYSAFRILVSQAEEEGITAAKNTLIWSFLGLGLIMVAYTIVRNLASIILQLF